MFLTYAMLGNLYVFIVMSYEVMTYTWNKALHGGHNPGQYQMVFILTGCLVLALLSFMCMHGFFIMTSTSSIEAVMLMRRNPFSHVIPGTTDSSDYWRNWKDTFGHKKRYWFIPWEPSDELYPACDGFNWRIRKVF